MGKRRNEEWKRVGGGENVPAPILKATAGAARVDPFLIGELHRATSHVWASHRDVDLAYVDRHRYIDQSHSGRPTPEGRRESKNLLETSTASTVMPRVQRAISPALRRAAPQLRVHPARVVSPHGRLDVLVLEVPLGHFRVTAGRVDGEDHRFFVGPIGGMGEGRHCGEEWLLPDLPGFFRPAFCAFSCCFSPIPSVPWAIED